MAGEWEDVAPSADWQNVSSTSGAQPVTVTDKIGNAAKHVGRQVGLTARYGIEGASALPNILGDVLGLQSSKGVSDLLTRVGLPQPEGKKERIVGDITRGMAGTPTGIGVGGALSKAASPVAKGVGEVLQSAPGLQTVSGGTGGLGAGAARELGIGPVGQTVAGLAGAVAPSAASSIPGAVKRGVQGGEASRQAGVSRIQQFEEAGTSPSASQAFQSPTLQGTEAFLARDPGGHSPMRNFAQKQASELGSRVDEVAGTLAGKTSPMVAGRAIEEGISGAGGFIDNFKKTSGQLYDALDQFIPPQKEVPASNLVSTVARLTRPTAGAEELSKTLMNAKVIEIGRATAKDMAGTPPSNTITILGADGKPLSTIAVGGTPSKATLPYDALKEVRTKIGAMIADAGLVSDIPRRQLKQMYAALSADMENAVKMTGNAAAVNAFNRANAYTRAGHQRIDNILQPVLNKASPEQMFNAALAGSKEGDSMIRTIMQSLPEEQKKVLSATILKKMGLAAAGKQGAEGTTFSIDTYLTNWNRLSPEAKRSLFSRYGSSFTKDLDTIAKTAADIKKGGQVYANPSGTAPALTLQHTLGGALLMMLTGHPGVAAAIGAELAITKYSANMMTDPKFVNWLARATTKPVSAAPAMMNELAQLHSAKERKKSAGEVLGIGMPSLP